MSAPFMQLYVADYLGDTQHLTTEQHGAYLLLLMTMWRHGCRLPNDPVKLARIARVSLRRWHLIAPDVMGFFTVDGDDITQKRLAEEYQKCASISQKRSASGKAGGDAKALKTKKPAVANASVLPQHSQIPDIREEANASSLGSEAKASSPRAVVGFAEFWNAYPRREGANPRAPAEKRFKAAVKAGADPAAIVAGVRGYAAELAAIGKAGTSYVAQAVTWLNQQRWQDYANAARGSPAGAAVVLDGWRPGMRTAEEILGKTRHSDDGGTGAAAGRDRGVLPEGPGVHGSGVGGQAEGNGHLPDDKARHGRMEPLGDLLPPILRLVAGGHA